MDGEKTGLDLPLDIQATAFQQQVWQALRTIPYGETRTYQQVAQAMGKGDASRAVGTACGA
ncbi:MAG: methylated-DNA--[protein]-cysteine S-methyltransferase, partial [Chloroflexi bacterium]|nr:methylated-DNA--[protein]-cysteine S-methyltransferase [Chloroflexota bacterium]